MGDFLDIFDYIAEWFEKLIAMFLQIFDWAGKTFPEADEEEGD